MGCCESRDVNPDKVIHKTTKPDYSKIKNLSKEPEFLSIKQLFQVPEIFLTLKRIERLNESNNTAVLHESSNLKLESLSQPGLQMEIPVYKLTLDFISYVSLSKIIDSILNFNVRKEWDDKLVLFENNENVLHSVFEYSIYSAEFYEEVFKFAHENTVGVLIRSIGGFEKCEKFIRPFNHFCLYSITEREERSVVEIYLKIDPKTFVAIIVQEVLKENVVAWGEKLYKYLSSK